MSDSSAATSEGRDVQWARSPGARAVRSTIQGAVLVPLVRFVSPVQLVNGERLKQRVKPAVFVSNHQSHFDTPVVIAALGRKIRKRLTVAAAADYFYKSKAVGAMASLGLGTVPFVREGGSSRASLDLLKRLAGDGWSILIFPSGTRGDRETFKPGFAYIAVDAGVDVVPLYLHGLKDTFPKGSKVPLPSGVLVGVGRTVECGADYEDLVRRTEQEHAAAKDDVIKLVKGWGG